MSRKVSPWMTNRLQKAVKTTGAGSGSAMPKTNKKRNSSVVQTSLRNFYKGVEEEKMEGGGKRPRVCRGGRENEEPGNQIEVRFVVVDVHANIQNICTYLHYENVQTIYQNSTQKLPSVASLSDTKTTESTTACSPPRQKHPTLTVTEEQKGL
eukprot:1365716-Amorphochlora_amoeboformis.AAC.1